MQTKNKKIQNDAHNTNYYDNVFICDNCEQIQDIKEKIMMFGNALCLKCFILLPVSSMTKTIKNNKK